MELFQSADIPWAPLIVLLLVYLLTYPVRWARLFETIYGYSLARGYITGVLLLTVITFVGLAFLGAVWYAFSIALPSGAGQLCGGGLVVLLWTYVIYTLDRRWRERAYGDR